MVLNSKIFRLRRAMIPATCELLSKKRSKTGSFSNQNGADRMFDYSGYSRCAESRESDHTFHGKKSRPKNIIFSWRNSIFKIRVRDISDFYNGVSIIGRDRPIMETPL